MLFSEIRFDEKKIAPDCITLANPTWFQTLKKYFSTEFVIGNIKGS